MCMGEGSHGKIMCKTKGLVLVVIGILFWLTNSGTLDGDFWNWLLPLLVILLGVKMLVMSMCKCKSCVNMKDQHHG